MSANAVLASIHISFRLPVVDTGTGVMGHEKETRCETAKDWEQNRVEVLPYEPQSPCPR